MAGSDNTCDIRLGGLGVQPKHASFTIEENSLYVTPVESAR